MVSMLERVIFARPSSLLVTVMCVVSLVAVGSLGIFESIGKHLQYSKFWNLNVEKYSTRKQIKLTTTTGMLMLYTPAFLAAVASFGLFQNQGLRVLLVKSTLAILFLTRNLEANDLGHWLLQYSRERASGMGVMAMTLRRLIFPPSSSVLITTMSVISFSSSILGFLEISGTNVQYSKFCNLNKVQTPTRKQSKLIGSRIGMLIIYTPAFLAAVASFVLFPNDQPRFLLLKSALSMQFFKRILEVLFVHKYSGEMALDCVIVGLGYFTTTSTIIYAQHRTQGFNQPMMELKYLGVVLFLLGIIGNFYHHHLLASLRREGEKGYKVPNGGLFGVVACPHYLFEILSFLGISFISQTFYGFSLFMSTFCYLMGRSYATRRWYLSKFEDFPKDVKAVIPLVF